MDHGFLVLLILASVTGLGLLVLRETAAMGTLLAVHLGIILALFLSLPYGKFVHAIYRLAALVRYALERFAARAKRVFRLSAILFFSPLLRRNCP